MPPESQPNLPELLYFSPEPNREGHASYTHVHEIIDNLRDMGWSISYYSPGYEIATLPGPIRRLFGIGKALLRAIFRYRPGMIYMRWHFAAFPLSLWARLCGVRVVVEVNGPVTDLFIAWPVTQKFKRFFAWLMISQLEWAAGIVAVTDGLAGLCRDITSPEKTIKVIPNGANTQHFHPEMATSPLDVENLPPSFCLFFGTMAPWQGIDDLLAAITDPAWPIDCPLLVAGDGERRAATESVAKKYPHKLRYLGRLAYEDLPKLVARSRFAFVCTQNLEGRANSGMAPLKLFESLASSIPVIATRMPFQADVVQDADAGLLVDENRPDQILNAVRQLLDDPERAKVMGSNGRDFVCKHHSWQARATDTHELLVSLKSAPLHSSKFKPK